MTSLGLALGGGGARAAAHVGVLNVLHQRGIKIDQIAGTSAGAIIGAMYAAYRDPEFVKNRYVQFLNSPVYKKLGVQTLRKDRDPESIFDQLAQKVQDRFIIMMTASRSAVAKRERLERVVEFLVPVKTFEELEIPIIITATDLVTGTHVEYSSGDLLEALVQSSSIPGFVPPTRRNNQILVDGGVSVPTPVLSLMGKVDFLLAVDIARKRNSVQQIDNLLKIINRTQEITSLYLNRHLIAKADFVVTPDVMETHWSEFEKYQELIDSGHRAMTDAFHDFESAFNSHKSWVAKLKEFFK